MTDATFRFAAWFRLFVGDVSNDVTDEVLANAFSKYPTFTKARVIRDKLSSKVSFEDTGLALYGWMLIVVFAGQVWFRRILGSRRLP